MLMMCLQSFITPNSFHLYVLDFRFLRIYNLLVETYISKLECEIQSFKFNYRRWQQIENPAGSQSMTLWLGSLWSSLCNSSSSTQLVKVLRLLIEMCCTPFWVSHTLIVLFSEQTLYWLHRQITENTTMYHSHGSKYNSGFLNKH